MDDDANWLILGDFNYVIYPNNRNKDGGNIQDMFLFNEAISKLAPVEIPLKGRKFTWSNIQDAPLLEKPDWDFTSKSWTNEFPNTLVLPLGKLISDHTPCLIQISTHIPKSKISRFVNFWMKVQGFKEVVKQT